MQSAQNLLRIGTTIIFIGFLLIFAGIVFTASQGSGNGQFGALIMIGPIPIAFGSSPQITSTMLGASLMIMLIYLFLWRKMR